MMIFSKDTEIARSIPVRIALYSASLFDARKSNHLTCCILSPIGALSCKPIPSPVFLEAPSTLRIHQSALSKSPSCWGIFAKKSVNICPFIAKQGLYWIPNSVSSIAHRAILHDKSGICMVLRRGRLVNMTIECVWK